MKWNPLDDEEEDVIVRKGTERPFSGAYENHYEAGMYACRRCDAYLYRSDDKFDARCGWPSFDDEVLGAVERKTDADGSRTEILCTRCGAHLGHVFEGERFTQKNVRHCVNSLSMAFVPKSELPSKSEEAYFAGGCFWCTEATFKMIRGVIAVVPGYAGGTLDNPTYEDVCRGDTGHAETVKIEYDPTVISYEALLEIFFSSHDPTTRDRQGNDIGTQYRSVIFFTNEMEKELAEKYVIHLEEEKAYDVPIVTEIVPLEEFFEAEEYHHQYFEKNPTAAYCQAVIAPKIFHLRKDVQKYLKK